MSSNPHLDPSSYHRQFTNRPSLPVVQPSSRYPSSPSSTASSQSDEDTPGPDPIRRGDDRNLRINPHVLHHPNAPALATPSSKLGSHPWPFNTLSPRLNSNLQAQQQSSHHPQEQSSTDSTNHLQISASEQDHHHHHQNTSILSSSSQQQINPPKFESVNHWIKHISQVNQPSSHHRPLSISSSLPHEILIQILRSLSSTSDLRRALLVCKAWCQCGIELLWHKPTFPSTSCLIKMLVSLASKNQTFPYISFIRRLNFSGIADHMTDHILLRLVNCTRLERLTLSGCNSITDDSIIKILKVSQDLVALDLSDCKLVTDECVHAVGQYSKYLQGLNLSGCKTITDAGLSSLRHCKALRRLKLKYCEKITDAAMIAVASACPLLLEVDLVGCKLITDASLWVLWKHSSHLRELSLSGCPEISDGGFPSSSNCTIGADGISHPILEELADENVKTNNANGHSYPYNPSDSLISDHFNGDAYDFISSLTSHRRLEESVMHFDHIRFLDLTSLAKLTDASLEGIIRHMPRIRNLVLAKCVGLTDEALNSICGLGKYLHYLHLGHVSSLTDRAVIRVARSCTRLRYIDLACCNNLTDMSVFELAQCLPRLKRIGLVRVTNITDQSVYTLVERTSLERIHLSYCDNISVGAIHWLLQRLHRLTHLSLTGVPAFRRTDLQAWCRAPPKDFNAHQRQAFCVYSGKGVNELRYYLAALYLSITTTCTRSRNSQPSPSNNSSMDEENTSNMTLSAAPIGPNLSVFNSMPDPRTMAAAMAAARQQANPRLYGLGNRRRELRMPERGGRVALSDFLHQGPSSSVNSSVISGNGQLLPLPGLPRHPSRTNAHANGDSGVTSNGLSAVMGRSDTLGNQPSMTLTNGVESDHLPVAGSSNLADVHHQTNNLHPTTGGDATDNTRDGLRSPIPLFPGASNTRSSLFELNNHTHDEPRASTSSAILPSRATGNERVDLSPTAGVLQYGESNGVADNTLRIPHHSITRRRSDVEMNGGSTRHHNPEGLGFAEDEEFGVGSTENGSSRLVLMGARSRSNGLNLEVPDRADSVSPIDISDDERPPP